MQAVPKKYGNMARASLHFVNGVDRIKIRWPIKERWDWCINLITGKNLSTVYILYDQQYTWWKNSHRKKIQCPCFTVNIRSADWEATPRFITSHDVMARFPYYWPFVTGIQWSPCFRADISSDWVATPRKNITLGRHGVETFSTLPNLDSPDKGPVIRSFGLVMIMFTLNKL